MYLINSSSPEERSGAELPCLGNLWMGSHFLFWQKIKNRTGGGLRANGPSHVWSGASTGEQFFQILLPNRRNRVRAVASGRGTHRHNDSPAVRHAFDFTLEDSEFGWIN